MSLGNEMPYRRSRRGADATGSLVFDQERRKHKDAAPQAESSGHAAPGSNVSPKAQ